MKIQPHTLFLYEKETNLFNIFFSESISSFDHHAIRLKRTHYTNMAQDFEWMIEIQVRHFKIAV